MPRPPTEPAGEAVWWPEGVIVKDRGGEGSRGVERIDDPAGLSRAHERGDGAVAQRRCRASRGHGRCIPRSPRRDVGRGVPRAPRGARRRLHEGPAASATDALEGLVRKVAEVLDLRGALCVQGMRGRDGWEITDVNPALRRRDGDVGGGRYRCDRRGPRRPVGRGPGAVPRPVRGRGPRRALVQRVGASAATCDRVRPRRHVARLPRASGRRGGACRRRARRGALLGRQAAGRVHRRCPRSPGAGVRGRRSRVGRAGRARATGWRSTDHCPGRPRRSRRCECTAIDRSS